MAPLSVYSQFAAGSASSSAFHPWTALVITCFNFIVAVWMVHRATGPGHLAGGFVLEAACGLYFGFAAAAATPSS